MGNVSQRVPTLHSVIACAPPTVMLHEPQFATWVASEHGERALVDGAKALAMTAIDFLCDDDLRRTVSDVFANTSDARAAELVGSAK